MTLAFRQLASAGYDLIGVSAQRISPSIIRDLVQSLDRAAVLFATACLLAACGDPTSRAGDPAVRDSAGIQIVENASSSWTEGQTWRLSAEPALDVGRSEGAPEYLLSDVRGALRRSDGTVVIANSGSKQIRMYDSRGEHIRSVGRPGRGPGEFQMIGRIHHLSGDSILAHDPVLMRMSIFSPEGRFVRSFSLERPPDGGFPIPVGILGDGSIVVRATVFGGRAPDGLQRRPVRFLHYSSTGEIVGTIALQPGSQTYTQTQSSGSREIVSGMPPLFARSQLHAVGPEQVILGGNEAYEVGVYTPDGVLIRLIRRRQEPRPVTEQAFAAARRTRLEAIANPQRRQEVERSFAAMPRPSVMPFYEEALTDDAGNLWIRDFQEAPDAPPVWTVFDREGRMLGTVSMPHRFRLTQIGSDFVLGTWRDDLDVEHVQMYALEKPV